LLAHGRWFSPGTPASSTTKTGRHDIAEILFKVVLLTINQPFILQNKVLVQDTRYKIQDTLLSKSGLIKNEDTKGVIRSRK
jgi:hypothetical protein